VLSGGASSVQSPTRYVTPHAEPCGAPTAPALGHYVPSEAVFASYVRSPDLPSPHIAAKLAANIAAMCFAPNISLRSEGSPAADGGLRGTRAPGKGRAGRRSAFAPDVCFEVARHGQRGTPVVTPLARIAQPLSDPGLLRPTGYAGQAQKTKHFLCARSQTRWLKHVAGTRLRQPAPSHKKLFCSLRPPGAR
jgi:hypothetical protein